MAKILNVHTNEPRVAIISHTVASGVQSGDFNSGAYQTRPLNVLEDPYSLGITLNANQITLPAGEYEIDAWGTSHDVNANKMRLQNITDNSTLLVGPPSFTGTTDGSVRYPSIVKGRVVITSTKVLELQHRCLTTKTSNGFGQSASFGDSEVYAMIKITKIK